MLGKKNSQAAIAVAILITVAGGAPGSAWPSDADRLDAPLLFLKRHNYQGGHIYDTYYQWRPGGGIYRIENPWAPAEEQVICPVVDPTSDESPGMGVYSDPALSWDGRRLLFCFKGEEHGSTSIYEIGVDGTGLRRLTDPGAEECALHYKGSFSGQHDISPAWLPDGRIVFTSTRQNSLVPCFNTGVDILHIMEADGTDIRPISVNYVNDFDPTVLPDGRILFSRWEYIDKTALTQQSLWTIFPDGSHETALYANNMVFPECVLQAQTVPGSDHLLVAALTPHNSPPRGTVAFIDPRMGKNSPEAIFNLEHPDNPTYNNGHSCDPWPISENAVLYSGRVDGHPFNVILKIDRQGNREEILRVADIDLHAPILVKARVRPAVIPDQIDREAETGQFFVQDIYEGLEGVERGEARWLRVIEETARISESPHGSPFNQTFLISAALGWSAKIFHGLVPVEPDGSVHFEAPSGRPLYFQALDGDGRLIQSMRSFVQASPGMTRSCIGCHETKFGAGLSNRPARARGAEPARLEPESWGSGFMDFPGMVQPILDRHCVDCHGGREGFAAGLDLSGGWTSWFNIAYENLVSRRRTQLTAHLIAGVDSMNSTAHWSAPLRAPRFHGSGAAPLADALVSGHDGRIAELTRSERDLILAWIDTNGVYYGTWDYAQAGNALEGIWPAVRDQLVERMELAGCGQCHDGAGFESDWFNLREPEHSRILRAPLAQDGDGLGLALCRDGRVDPAGRRIRLLPDAGYGHQVTALEQFPTHADRETTPGLASHVTFLSTDDEHYQAMLAIIEEGRRQALAAPRVDMPGADIREGEWRQIVLPSLPDEPVEWTITVSANGETHLAWPSARIAGLRAEIHRGDSPEFPIDPGTCLDQTLRFEYTDLSAPAGEVYYALVFVRGSERSRPTYRQVIVPESARPQPPPILLGPDAPTARLAATH